MQPTREQEDSLFSEWIDAACLVWMPEPDVIEPASGTHLNSGDVRQLIRVAWQRAHTAGRAQGLGEAAAVCATERADFIELAARNDGRQSDMAFGSVNSAERISEAIEQLKGKP